MVHVVGLIGANGRVGGAIARNLIPAANDGKIQVVLFYRTQSPLKGFQSSHNVELRAIDLDGSAASLKDAVKGVNVFISALSPEALTAESKVVEALAVSSDIVTYIPSVYSAPWSSEDEADSALGPTVGFMHSGWDKAKSSGMGVTAFYTGGFEDYMFEYGFIIPAIKENTVWANKNHLKHKFPITLSAQLGHAIAQVAASEPETIKNKSFSVVSYWPTGQDFVDLYSQLNESPAKVKDYTTADRDALRADSANMGAVKAGYFDHWDQEDWRYDEFEDAASLDNFEIPTLEETARRFV